jgi:hypothetical protein
LSASSTSRPSGLNTTRLAFRFNVTTDSAGEYKSASSGINVTEFFYTGTRFKIVAEEKHGRNKKSDREAKTAFFSGGHNFRHGNNKELYSSLFKVEIGKNSDSLVFLHFTFNRSKYFAHNPLLVYLRR